MASVRQYSAYQMLSFGAWILNPYGSLRAYTSYDPRVDMGIMDVPEDK